MNASSKRIAVLGSDLIERESKGVIGPVGYRLLRHLRENGHCADSYVLALYIEAHDLGNANISGLDRLTSSTWALNLAVTELARRLPASSL